MSNNPTRESLRVDVPLTNMSIGYSNPLYIIDDLLAHTYVDQQSGIMPHLEQSHFYRDNVMLRAPGTESDGVGFKADLTNTYFCNRFSVNFTYDDDTKMGAMKPFDLDRLGVKFITDRIKLNREKAFADTNFVTGVWGSSTQLTSTDQWDDYSGSDPLGDVETAKEAVLSASGAVVNKMVLGGAGWSKLKNHPDLIDRIKHTQVGNITRDLAAGMFEIEKLLVGSSLYTASPEGTAEGSVAYTRVWGKNCLLLYTAEGLEVPSAANTLVWDKGGKTPQYIKRMRNELKETNIIEGNSYFQHLINVIRSGYFYEDCVS